MAKRIRAGPTAVPTEVAETIQAGRMAARMEVPTAVVEDIQPRHGATAVQVVGITVVQAAVPTVVRVVAAVTVRVLTVEEDIAKPG